MKKFVFIALIVSLGIFSACVVVVDDLPHLKGNGLLMSFTQSSGSSFDKINVSGGAEVRFHESSDYKTEVTVDSNLIDYTEVSRRNNTVYIRTKSGNCSFTRYVVDVYCPELTGVTVSGSGSFIASDSIFTSTFDANVSGSGKIDGAIECDALSAKITGSGKIIFSGSAIDSDIDISGSGTFNGYGLIANNVDVRISGSGTANVYAADNLIGNISGSGRINYRGDPTVDSTIAGSGQINKR